MNRGIIRYVLGKVIQIEALLLLVPVLCALVYNEHEGFYYLDVAMLCIVVGTVMTIKKPKDSVFYLKEGCISTAASWIFLSLFGAIPFVLTGEIPNYINALFETISGFTTTGASILPEVESLSHSSLLWRSFTHWVGGMGILVFMLVFIPSNADEMNIMRAESPGPSVEKMVPKVRDTATTLYAIYTAMTVTLMIALALAGMPFFDSICLSFGTAGTGGFGIRGDSIAGYSSLCQSIITVGMVLFGVNFNFYYLIIMRKFKHLLNCEEVIWYVIIYLFAFQSDRLTHTLTYWHKN